MNYPSWQLAMGGGQLIALVAIFHVFISHFAVGGGLFLVVTEHLARRRDDAGLLGWLKGHTRFFALTTLVAGAVSGVGIWFTIGLVHPTATSALIHIFVWGWAIEWVFFVVEIAAALIYSSTWEVLDRRTHLIVGWIYFAAALMSLVVINGILAFMFSPGDWLTTRSFFDGFFNPTYLPSLLVRVLACLAFAGIYVLATAWREAPELRTRLVRYGALWALPATLAGPLAAWLYFKVAGAPAMQVLEGAVPKAPIFLKITIVATAGYGALLALMALLVKRFPRVASLPMGAALMLLAFASLGGSEYLRENLRKPFVIGNASGGYLYSTGLTPEELEQTRQRGILASDPWGPRESASAPLTDAQKGAELFRVACQSCHSVSGHNAVRKQVDGRPVAAIAQAIRTLEKRRGKMPPFAGNEQEVLLLARWLGALDGEVEPEPPLEASAKVAAGPALLEQHCLSCHELKSSGQTLGMATRVKGWSAAKAYENLGQLPKLNEAMPPFEGNDEERKSLADYLSQLGNDPSEGGKAP